MGFPAEEQARKRMQVTIEYDAHGKRTTRTFPSMQAAKRFYVKCSDNGLNPSIHSEGTDHFPRKEN